MNQKFENQTLKKCLYCLILFITFSNVVLRTTVTNGVQEYYEQNNTSLHSTQKISF